MSVLFPDGPYRERYLRRAGRRCGAGVRGAGCWEAAWGRCEGCGGWEAVWGRCEGLANSMGRGKGAFRMRRTLKSCRGSWCARPPPYWWHSPPRPPWASGSTHMASSRASYPQVGAFAYRGRRAASSRAMFRSHTLCPATACRRGPCTFS